MKDFLAKWRYMHDIGRDNNDPPISSVNAGPRLRAKIGDEEYRKFMAWARTPRGQATYFLSCVFSPIAIMIWFPALIFWIVMLRIYK